MKKMCEFCEIVKTESGYGFGKDFKDDSTNTIEEAK